MVLLSAKNCKAGCLFRPNFLKQVVIEIQKMEHPFKNFQSAPLGGTQIFAAAKLNFKIVYIFSGGNWLWGEIETKDQLKLSVILSVVFLTK